MKLLISFVIAAYFTILITGYETDYYRKRTLLILEVGDIKDELVEKLKDSMEEKFFLRAQIQKRDDVPSFTYNELLQSFYADNLIDCTDFSSEYSKVLIIISADIYTIRNVGYFHYIQPVFGLADDKSAIITAKNISFKQEIGLAYHEMGHTFGLDHCKDSLCYMSEGDGFLHGLGVYSYYCTKCNNLLLKSIQK